MKKIIFSLLLLIAVGVKTTQAQETPTMAANTKVTYWYYPSYNVYYNEADGQYWYYDEPTIKWIYSKELPTIYVIKDKDVKYQLYYDGPDVWKDNPKHKTKYKVKKDGKIKDKSNKSDDKDKSDKS